MMPLVNTFPAMNGGDDDEEVARMDALEDALESNSRLLIMRRQRQNLHLLPTLLCSHFII